MKDKNVPIFQNTFICDEIYSSDYGLKDLETVGMPEISIVTDGNGIHKIINQIVPCKKGDIFIINADVPHKYFTAQENEKISVTSIRFDPKEWFDGKISDIDNNKFCYGIFSENSIVTYAMLNSQTLKKALDLFAIIKSELDEKQSEWKSAVKANLTLLLITVGRYVSSAVKTELNVKPKEWILVSSVMTSVEERYSDPDMTLASIAESLYISQSYLSKIFKAMVGEPFFEYVQKIRADHATDMLKNTKLSVDDIAHKCGVRDVASFYTLFRKNMGMSPTQFRKNIKENKSKGELKMQILAEISENLQKGKSKIVKELVQNAIDAGASPEEILNKGLLDGMNIIGEKFKKNEVYVPEVLVAARAMNMGMQILKPHLVNAGVEASGKVCIGTVQGDLHDIGKNLVKMMMEGKGLEVIDLGTDVAPETFVNTAIEQNCQVICCSALLTTTMDVMADVVKAAETAGIRDKVKIMVGGAPVTDEFCKHIGADVYTSDAASAADAALKLCKA